MQNFRQALISVSSLYCNYSCIYFLEYSCIELCLTGALNYGVKSFTFIKTVGQWACSLSSCSILSCAEFAYVKIQTDAQYFVVGTVAKWPAFLRYINLVPVVRVWQNWYPFYNFRKMTANFCFVWA